MATYAEEVTAGKIARIENVQRIDDLLKKIGEYWAVEKGGEGDNTFRLAVREKLSEHSSALVDEIFSLRTKL